MKSVAIVCLISVFATVPAVAQDSAGPAAGKYIYDANGRILSTIMRVTPTGSVQVVLDGRQFTIPASTISVVDGKFTTSLTKREILKLR